jgi:hypothetical protein
MTRPRTRLKNGVVDDDSIDESSSLIAARSDHFAAVSWRILLVASSECARIRQQSSLEIRGRIDSRLSLERGGAVELGDN